MKILLVFLLAAGVCAQQELSFEQWQAKYGKTFSAREKFNCMKNFIANKAAIEAHNLKDNSYRRSLNEFSHINAKQFIATRCNTKPPPGHFSRSPKIVSTSSGSNVSLDYSSLMQPIQSQKSCGACWAFATMAQIEARLKSKNPTFNSTLSPQYIMDCDPSNNGCTGGWPTYSMWWLQSASKGKNSAPFLDSYPYVGSKQTCKMQIPRIPIGITTVHEEYLQGDEAALMKFLNDNGPVVVAYYGTDNFISYATGVFYDPKCSTISDDCNKVNHAMVLVGYGTDSRLGDYWIVKNSWGTSWGENGYARIARNKKYNCNIACFAMWTA